MSTTIKKKKKVRPRGLYLKQKLVNAVTAVLDDEMTSVFAQTEYGVPQSTIRMHVNNVSLGIGGGRRSYLNNQQEGYLVDLINVAKRAWKSIVSTYFRRSQKKSIRKIDFPKSLNELYQRAITTITVSGGFRNSGAWPHNPDAMKHKVVRSRKSQNQVDTNNLSATDVLTSLNNAIQTLDTLANNSTYSSNLIQNNTNSSQHVSRRNRTLDDSDEDESDSGELIDVSRLHNIPVTDNESIHSDESFDIVQIPNNIKSTRTLPTTNSLMSPQAAAKSIITTYSKDKTIPSSSSTQPIKTNSRIRVQRKYGEVITEGTLLDELKKKANAKKNKKKNKTVL
ncbi:unnamed protein product, partial [Adineta steineri]